MSLEALFLSEAAAFALAASRVAGFVVTSPFPGQHVPTMPKVGLVLLLAWVARAADATRPDLGLDLLLIGRAMSEVGVGVLIGFTVRVTFSAAEVLGASISQSTGLTFGQVYDPTLGSEDAIPSRLVTTFAMLLFLAVGAHRVALAYALESFRVLPVGHAVTLGAAAPSLVGFAGEAMEAGIRLSLPVMAVGLAIQVVLALVARASPSLQVFSVGLGLTVAAGLLTLLGSIDDTTSGLVAELARGGSRVETVLFEVSGAP